MKRKLNWCWRLLATGFSFSVFGIGGLIVPLYAVPWLLLTAGGPTRERRARWLVHTHFRFFINMMRALGIMTYELKGLERLRAPGQLILANHPSLVDVVLLIGLLPQADCVVKGGLLRNPFMRTVIKLAGYIANDNPEQVLNDARASLSRGNSLIIFPEGTRSVPGQSLRLQRGAANVAVRLQLPIRPVVITVTPPTLTKHVPWYHIPPQGPFHMSLRVMPELAPGDFELQQDVPASLAARYLTKKLEHYFTEELTHYAGARART
ncbi:lysophospholipid acyltransferase family protein [Simiduia aestuariiviva]|uniref:1-acyl-sn-glycerol-3-phosphate acyltransferase n=1 Tax=Simiduia aestuariiviva TaxID=1510459 RepID=A0A839US00_9GAMM|nr:lysophospholipid acyltransferase family protein [Simiduia aestuariiviva]MBB3169260.1 1-acyl-sn-glycerol-3-phosphate acyltransferase [Simiduia aestuariiviva]